MISRNVAESVAERKVSRRKLVRDSALTASALALASQIDVDRVGRVRGVPSPRCELVVRAKRVGQVGEEHPPQVRPGLSCLRGSKAPQ